MSICKKKGLRITALIAYRIGGILEEWNTGRMEKHIYINPIFHYSNIPEYI